MAASATGSSATPHYHVGVLGGFRVQADGYPVEMPTPAQRLVALLALLDRPVPRPTVAEQLWPERAGGVALTRLREALFQARRAGSALVVTSGCTVGLNESATVDIGEVEAAARDLMAGRCDSLPEAADRVLAQRLLDRELLADWHDLEWVEPERFRWDQFRLHTLEALSSACRACGCYRQAIELAQGALRVDPYHESCHALIIELHLEFGNRAAALRQFDRYRELIVCDLGLTPSARVEGLMAACLPT